MQIRIIEAGTNVNCRVVKVRDTRLAFGFVVVF
jgi:hypothetical protein